MVGLGSSGKSTVCDFSEQALECYAYQMDGNIFDQNNKSSSKSINTFDQRPVIRIVLIPEINKNITETSIFKSLVEGEGNTTKLYQEESHKIEHKARIFASMNELPKMKSDDTGVSRRYSAYPHKSK